MKSFLRKNKYKIYKYTYNVQLALVFKDSIYILTGTPHLGTLNLLQDVPSCPENTKNK